MRSDAAPGRVPRGLYAVTPETADTAGLIARVRQCLEGGAVLLQYRAKSASRELAWEQAGKIAAACRAAGVPFIVNDSVDLAMAVGADGVHVGRDDAGVAEARRRMPNAIVGASCYADPDLAAKAATAGADYVAIGSVFASPTKPGAVRAPFSIIQAAHDASGLPVAAIGGITLDNAPSVIAAGAQLLAVVSALFDSMDVRAAARDFARLYAQPRQGASDVRAQPRAV
jgi:thiamine-phosphate pyrophosphorylase